MQLYDIRTVLSSGFFRLAAFGFVASSLSTHLNNMNILGLDIGGCGLQYFRFHVRAELEGRTRSKKNAILYPLRSKINY